MTPCAGKITHATAAGAHDALKRQVNRRKFARYEGSELVVYRCQRCTGWHVGNQLKEPAA